MIKTQFEVTTSIGCPVDCKFCPQDRIVERYTGARTLTLKAFTELIQTVPSSVPIIFAGVSEPFLNSATPDMIWYANKKGHAIQLFTTLTGLKYHDAIRLTEIPFESVVIHLPDAHGNAKIKMTPTWHRAFEVMAMSAKNLHFMNMGADFVSDRSEEIVRETMPIIHKGPVMCYRHEIPDYIMMPNGHVFFCCQTKGQRAYVGSLYENTYPELVARHPQISKRLQNDSESLCHKCTWAKPRIKYQALKYMEMLK